MPAAAEAAMALQAGLKPRIPAAALPARTAVSLDRAAQAVVRAKVVVEVVEANAVATSVEEETSEDCRCLHKTSRIRNNDVPGTGGAGCFLLPRPWRGLDAENGIADRQHHG